MLLKYNNELTIRESIEGYHITRKSEQHILTHKYEILRSFVPLVKHYHVTDVDDDNKLLKIKYQCCNVYARCDVKSVKLLYITFPCAGMATLVLSSK